MDFQEYLDLHIKFLKEEDRNTHTNLKMRAEILEKAKIVLDEFDNGYKDLRYGFFPERRDALVRKLAENPDYTIKDIVRDMKEKYKTPITRETVREILKLESGSDGSATEGFTP